MKKLVFLIIFLILVIPSNIKAITTEASSVILMDINSKRILYAKNIHDVRSVASISKIMTAILTIENVDIKKKVIIKDEIDKSYGSGIYIKKEEQLTIKDLLYGLMLRSGNDASYSLAVNTFKTEVEFVKQMNILGKKIGMKNTTFNNPNGLDEIKGNYSTAYDMALLGSYAYQNKVYRKITSTKKYKLKTNMNTYIWYNKNKLLTSYKYTTGGKTGYTKVAKRTLLTTASQNNLNLIVVTLNDGNDFNDHKNLFEYGFKNYQNYNILKKGKLTIQNNYYKDYELYIKDDFNYPLLQEEKNAIKIEYEMKKVRKIKNNMIVGKAKIYLNEELIHEKTIYVKVIKKETFFNKIIDWIMKHDK
ncbi:MAG: D-alanyl-D-alanine carboxypeptidase [Bacilli bacterium]|nr:D-alanyl-D-alanine carboxypeptidase [Bacilli bacterium]